MQISIEIISKMNKKFHRNSMEILYNFKRIRLEYLKKFCVIAIELLRDFFGN